MSIYNITPSDLNPLLAYQLYISVKLDFMQKKYDYHNDLVITKCGQDSFNNRNDRYFFIKISDSFLYQSRYIPLLASNLYLNPKIYIKDLLSKASLTNALSFRKYMNNFYGSFETDIQKLKYSHNIKLVEELYHPIYVTNYFSLNDIHPLTCAILNKLYYKLIFDTDWDTTQYQDMAHNLTKLLKYSNIDIDRNRLEKIVNEIIND